MNPRNSLNHNGKKYQESPKLLLILVIGWIPLWIFERLLASSRFSIGFFSDFLITVLVILAGLVLLILSIVVAVLSLFRWLARRKRPHITAFLPLVIMLVTYYLPIRIPSRTEMTFYYHRDEFIALVDWSLGELQSTAGRGFRLPESPLYESAWVYPNIFFKTVSVEFFVDDSYRSLMYISTDNPGDISACSEDVGPLKKLETNWYICKNDWP